MKSIGLKLGIAIAITVLIMAASDFKNTGEPLLENSNVNNSEIKIREWNVYNLENTQPQIRIKWSWKGNDYYSRFFSPREITEEDFDEEWIKNRLKIRIEDPRNLEKDLEENTDYKQLNEDFKDYEILNIKERTKDLSVTVNLPKDKLIISVPYDHDPFKEVDGKPQWYREVQSAIEKEKEKQNKLKKITEGKKQNYDNYIGKIVDENE